MEHRGGCSGSFRAGEEIRSEGEEARVGGLQEMVRDCSGRHHLARCEESVVVKVKVKVVVVLVAWCCVGRVVWIGMGPRCRRVR